jgi:hypothetical protein
VIAHVLNWFCLTVNEVFLLWSSDLVYRLTVPRTSPVLVPCLSSASTNPKKSLKYVVLGRKGNYISNPTPFVLQLSLLLSLELSLDAVFSVT